MYRVLGLEELYERFLGLEELYVEIPGLGGAVCSDSWAWRSCM